MIDASLGGLPVTAGLMLFCSAYEQVLCYVLTKNLPVV